MAFRRKTLPSGNESSQGAVVVRTAADVGRAARNARREQALTQLDLAGIGNTGNRFIIELEKGKPTLQLQKVIDALALVGLEIVIRRKGSAS